jgi:hypothetical protein
MHLDQVQANGVVSLTARQHLTNLFFGKHFAWKINTTNQKDHIISSLLFAPTKLAKMVYNFLDSHSASVVSIKQPEGLFKLIKLKLVHCVLLHVGIRFVDRTLWTETLKRAKSRACESVPGRAIPTCLQSSRQYFGHFIAEQILIRAQN